MKILIVGTGVVGITWGWALLQADNDITHFVKPGQKDKFEDGVTLDLRDGRKGNKKDNVVKYALKCVETISPSDHYELIIVSVNFNQVVLTLTNTGTNRFCTDYRPGLTLLPGRHLAPSILR